MSFEGQVTINNDITIEVESKLSEPELKSEVESKLDAEVESKLSELLEPKSILLLLLQVLSSDTKFKKINFELSDNIQDILYKLIYFSPDFLNEIDKLVNEIIKDNKIDSNDIPNLILLIKHLYELIHKLKEVNIDDDKRVEVCSNILKFLVRFLVEERKVDINSESKELVLELMDKLIDSCVSLIGYLPSNKIKTNCFTYIKTLFGYK
jgi:hypothetical protein